MDLNRADYHSYLLRLWRDRARHTWHASLQSTASRQVYHFVNMEALVAFLEARMAESEDEPPAEPSSP